MLSNCVHSERIVGIQESFADGSGLEACFFCEGWSAG